MPRRHTKAGNRPRGPQPLDELRKQLGLPSDAARSVPLTDNAKADETAGRDVVGHRASETKRDADEALGRPRQRSNAIARTGGRPVNDRLLEVRPQGRTARIHLPEVELETEAEQREANRAWVRGRADCPRCGASLGERCTGRRGDRASNHLERLALAWVPRG